MSPFSANQSELAAENEQLRARIGELERELREVVAGRRAGGEIVKLRGTSQDITERIHAEQKMRNLTTAIEQAAEAVVITDLAGNIQYCNPAFERITGYSKEEAIGKNPRILNSGKQGMEFYKRLWNTIKSGKVWSGHFTNKTKEGLLYEEEATISPIYGPSGTITGFVAVKRDVTDQLQLEAQFRQAQKMEAIGQLAGGVAHDFNNILQGIQGHIEFACMELARNSQAYQDLMEALRAVERARMLVRQLLTFSRREVLRREPFDLIELVTGMSKMLRRVIGEHIQLDTSMGGKPQIIDADAGQIEQVLMNLCVNAKDAMPGGGTILITVGQVAIDAEFKRQHAWAREGQYVALKVSDTGNGMAPEVLDHIFEPFFTTKPIGHGTGLGLATVYGIVKQHEGFIHVESELGRGTTFTLFFPAVKAVTEHEETAREVETAFGDSETILLAEDDELVRSLATRILRDCGYRVLVARDGEEAVRLFTEQGAGIQLVLLDVVMPKLSGKAAGKQIREINRSVPILYSTGYDFNLLESSLVPEAEDKLIMKPFVRQELLRKVREQLSRGE